MANFECGTNFLQPNGFRVVINRENYANLEFFAQGVQHPDLNIDTSEVNFRKATPIPFAGESLQFGQLTFDVLMDEDMNVYQELYLWFEGMVEFNHRLNITQDPTPPSYQDITLFVLTSSNNPNRAFKYVNATPINLGNINFSATSTGEYITFPVTFRFDYFTLA